MKRIGWLLGTGATLLSVLVFLGHRQAQTHVRTIMGGIDAPVTCASCHVYMKPDFAKRFLDEDYLSPRDLAVSPDGLTLFVVAEEAGKLLVVDLEDGRVQAHIEVGHRPHSVAVSADGSTAYVTNSWSDEISVIDVSRREVVRSIPTGMEPSGLALCGSGRTLYVANAVSDDVSVIDVEEGVEVGRLAAGNNPYAVERSRDGATVYVTSRLTRGTDFREAPRTEVTLIDTATRRVRGRAFLDAAHLVEGVAPLSGDAAALVTLVRPKNLIPSSQVQGGWMLTYGLGVVSSDGRRVVQLLLDDQNGYFADPYDVVVTPDGTRAFVSHAAADVVSAIDLRALLQKASEIPDERLQETADNLGMSRHYVLRRISTGPNPKRMAVSPDGARIYVAERLADQIAVIDAERMEVVDRIDLGGPRRVSTQRLGAQVFHAARAFQGQFSCRSCHPAMDQDALAWDFAGDGLGLNVVNTMTLRDVGPTAPFKWAGTNTSLYMQDGIRFAKHLTRVDPFPTRELRAIVAYMYATRQPPNRYANGQLTEAQLRGKSLFERDVDNAGRPIAAVDRCITCHDGPYHTVRQKFDVGTRRDTDTPGMLFDTPQLVNITESAPYLHDGSAATLEQIWTENSVNDEHGFVSDFNKNQLNDLIEYLRTLGPPQ